MADKQFSSKPWLLPLLAIIGVIVFAGVSVTGIFYFSKQQVVPLRSRIEALDRIKPNNFSELEKLAQQQKALIDAENAVRAPLIQALVGVLATIATSTAAWIAYQNYLATQEKNTADRFSKAIEQLGNENSIHVRLGGIFALEQIANTEDKYYWQIMESLTAYVRLRARWEQEIREGKVIFSEAEPPDLREDIQAVMIVLSRRKYCYEVGPEQHRLNLSCSNLGKLQLPKNTNFNGVDLRYSNLSDSLLPTIKLDKALLLDTNLIRATLSEASLHSAYLLGACAYMANFENANLQNANFRSANVRRANFSNADLRNANLHARVDEAAFQGAILDEATFWPCSTREAWGRSYELLLDAEIGLTQEQLDVAASYEKVILPRSFNCMKDRKQ